MRLADKLGRDEAVLMEKMFSYVQINNQSMVNICKRTKLYKFFINKDANNLYFVKNKSIERDKIIYKITLEKYLKFKVITHEEFKSLILQIADPEAILLAEGVIEYKLRPKWKRKEKKLSEEEILTYKFKSYDTNTTIITDNNK